MVEGVVVVMVWWWWWRRHVRRCVPGWPQALGARGVDSPVTVNDRIGARAGSRSGCLVLHCD